jgi:hypothetical protein
VKIFWTPLAVGTSGLNATNPNINTSYVRTKKTECIMSKILKFGEDVEGYNIPVLNEREIRASAGILFFGMLMSLMQIMYKQDFLLIKYFIIIFLTDFIIRVFGNPKFSPSLIIGRLIVRN